MPAPVSAKTRASAHDVAVFTRQFLAMIDAGLPVHKALDIYARGDESGLGRVVDQVSSRVLSGSSLSAALSLFPRVFSPVYVGIVKAGEQSGRLNLMLEQLATLLERQDGLKRKLTASLTYPAFLMGASLMCAAAFMFYILPAMGPLYQSLNVPLPLPTRILVNLGELLKSPSFLISTLIATLLAVFVGWPAFGRLLTRQPELRLRLHQALLELPLLGNVLSKMAYARILFTMSTLLEVGIPAGTALHMVRDVTNNAAIRRALATSGRRLEEGAMLGESLDNVLPNGAVMMITVGEESSDVVRSAQYVARVYEEDAEMAVTYFAAMSEPVIMAAMGVVAAFLILALLLPIISLLQKM